MKRSGSVGVQLELNGEFRGKLCERFSKRSTDIISEGYLRGNGV